MERFSHTFLALLPRRSQFVRLVVGLIATVGFGSSARAQLVGTLSGEFSVDNRGAANYSIPLKISPGRGGMEPKLSINYSSATGNGPVGVGGSISTGFPQAITRGRSILARDGVVQGVTFTASDKFYLDGKRLIYLSGGTGYGTPGSVYRTEVDSFVTVTTTGTGSNIDAFVVTDKSGIKMTFGKYGATTDGYQAGGGEMGGLANAYALKRVEDTVGNYVTLGYNNPYPGEYVLNEIDYTGNSGASPVSPGEMITLTYTARSDSTVAYETGRSFPHTQRLSTITALSGSTTVATYAFAYNTGPNSGRSRLNAITPQLADPNTNVLQPLPATAINWNDDVKNFVTQTTNFTMPDYSALPPYNGYDDYVAIGDFDGDGKDDYVSYDGGFLVHRSTGTGWESSPHLWMTDAAVRSLIPPGAATYLVNFATVHFLVCDINGDGLKDLVFWDNSFTGLYAVVSTGSSFVGLDGGPNPTKIADITSLFVGPMPNQAYNGDFLRFESEGASARITVGDFTGDGRDDVAILPYDGKLHLYESTGNGFINRGIVSDVLGGAGISTSISDWTWTYLYTEINLPQNVSPMAVDLNGDGRMDYVVNLTGRAMGTNALGDPYYMVNNQFVGCLSKSDGTFTAPVWIAGNLGHGPSPSTIARDEICVGTIQGDFNGDGLPDFLTLSNTATGDSQWTLRLSVGSSASGNPSFQIYNFVAPTKVTINGETDLTYTNVMTKAGWHAASLDTVGGLLGWSGYPSRAAGDTAMEAFHALEVAKLFNTFAIDVNGDGLTDLVWYVGIDSNEAASSNVGWWGMLSTGTFSSGTSSTSIGTGFSAPVRLHFLDGVLPGQMFDTTHGNYFTSVNLSTSADFDGDGQPDLMCTNRYLGRSPQMKDIAAHANWGENMPWGFIALARDTDSVGTPPSADTVRSVVDGLGRTTAVTYKAAKADSIYTPGASVSYPIRELRASTSVVSDVYHDSGSATPAHFTYQYSGNCLDLSGRGALGFHSFVTLDAQTNLFKYQFLAQSFPMTGLAQREQTYRYWETGSAPGIQTNFRFISSHDNTVVFDLVSNGAGGNYGTVYPFISQAIESRWEDSNNAHFTVAKTNQAGGPESKAESLFTATRPGGAHITISAKSWFDNQAQASAPQTTLPNVIGYNPSDTDPATGANTVTGTTTFTTFSGLPAAITYGNLTKLATDYDATNNPGQFTETVTTTYKPPTVINGVTTLSGLVDTVNTSAAAPGYSDAAPTKSCTYFGSTPLVQTETVNGGTAQLTTVSTYTRDSLGRVTATSIAGTDLQAAGQGGVNYTTSQNTAFDPLWDQPTTSLDNYGHTTTTAYHAFLGKPVSVTDVNGAQVTTQYDALGRPAQVTDVLKNLTTTSTFAWDATQSVGGPSGFNGVAAGAPITGVTLTSAYKVTVTTTVKPTITTWYDRLGRAIRTLKDDFNSQQVVTDTAYNNLGQVIATSLPYLSGGTPLWTTTTYDALGRVVAVTAPNGTVTTHTYKGRITQVSVDAPNLGGIDPAPQVNTTLVGAKGQTVAAWNNDNLPALTLISGSDAAYSSGTTPSVAFTLDGFGRMRTTTLLGQSQTITATYDTLGHQTQLSDPDKGTWLYVNSALGQVLTHTDARSNVTTSVFDRLGRPFSRVTTGSGSTETANFYYYDSADDPTLHTVAKGLKGWIGAPEREECNATGSYATTNLHYYDAKGRPSLELAQSDSKWFYTFTDYIEPDGSDHSRLSHVRHFWKPSGAEAPGSQPYLWQDFGYQYTYDAKSYLLNLTDSLGRSWWDSPVYDYMDRVTSVRKGSGYTTTRTYRPEDGVLTAINTGSIQNLSFGFDGLGNLTSRTDNSVSPGSPENFSYDNLNRLTGAGNDGTVTYLLSGGGNIQSKNDVNLISSGTYTYDAVHPHAVAAAFGYGITYDANGNLLTRTKAGDQSAATWTGFDKPRSLWRVNGAATAGSEFHYNANRSRVMQLEFDGVTGTFPAQAPAHYNRKRVYALGSTLELNYDNLVTSGTGSNWQLKDVRIYVPGPDGIIGAREFYPQLSGQQERTLVYHYDHLGSITAISDFGSTTGYSLVSGNQTGRYSEDAWGQRRNPLTWNGAPTTATDGGGASSLTPRGFTGHEMLDGLGLVHMNGRIYDPLLGRFLSADILVQAPNNLQAYNRYSYVLNNPLSFTDPSGFETIAQLEEKRKKESAEKQAAQKAAYAKGGFWGGVKNLFSKANIEHGAKIIEYTNRIAAIHDHADALSRINHASVDARKLDDVSAQYAVQELGLSYLKVIPFASVGGKMVTGDFGDAAKDAAVQSVFLWAGSKVAGLQGQGSQEIEAEISSRITTAAAEGAAAVGTRQAIARQAYIAAGYSEEEIATHLAGIDFSKPVETAVIPKGTKVAQWQPHTGQGSYYTTLETPGNTLGVDPAGRSQYVYTTTREVTVLRSTAADTSNMENLPARARGPGGGTQFFSNEKSAFQKE